MSIIIARNISKIYAATAVFNDLSFSIPKGARIGLVGPNGVGKTTLLRIISAEEEPSQGSLVRARNQKIGYLPQVTQFNSHKTLWQESLKSFEHLLVIQKELHRLENEMKDGPASVEILETYGRLQESFEQQGGYTYEHRIQYTLTGLGFVEKDFHRPVKQLSGGQKTRALLGNLLLSSPDLLLLDEPTNHLDLASIEWLEGYLKEWDGTVLIVSHDRYFLDQVVSTIWEMTPALEEYRGNYSSFLAQRQDRYQRRLAEYSAQQAFIEKESDYIRRNIAGQNTRQAQGRRKRLERMLEEVRLIPPSGSRSLHFNLKAGNRSGELVLRTENLSIGFHDEPLPLFQVADLTLLRGECAAILGPNGAGKTTFLRTLLEEVPPYQGTLTLGASLNIGYFAQAHEDLNQEKTLMEEIESIQPKMLPAEIRSYLAQYLFTGDDVFNQVRTLSGGERGRLALAKLALLGANLLLLDEPTNHLDLPSQEILQAVLRKFNGTILLVTHDRFLVDGLATQIWQVQTEKNSLNVFIGSYSEYKDAKLEENPTPTEDRTNVYFQTQNQPSSPGRPGNKISPWKRKKLLEEMEIEITRLENRLGEIGRILEKPPADATIVHQLGEEHENLRQKLEEILIEWTELADD